MPSVARPVFVFLVFALAAFAGCVDAEPERPDGVPAPIGAPSALADDVVVDDDGLARIVTSQSFEGRFESDERTSQTVGSIGGAPVELRFPIIEVPRPGVPATVELVLRYERNDPAPIFTAPLQLDVDLDLPPFVSGEPEEEGDEVHRTFTAAPDGPVHAVVRHAAPNPANQESIAFTLDVTVVWHLDAVPAGVPIALHIDPAKGLPELRPLAKRLSYALFDPAGAFLGAFPLDGPLAPDAQAAGEYRLAVLDPPASMPPGAPLFQVVGTPTAAPHALAWGRHVLASTPLAPGGATETGFDVPVPLWGLSLEAVGDHAWANGYEWAIEAGGTAVMHGGCDACSGNSPGAVLGSATAGGADLVAGAHRLTAEGLHGDADLVVVGHVPAPATG